MDTAEGTGKTLEDAKQTAVDRLGVSEDEVEFEIITKPGGISSWFGTGNYRVVARRTVANETIAATMGDTAINEQTNNPAEEIETDKDADSSRDDGEQNERLERVREVGERAREIAFNIAEMVGVDDVEVELTGVDEDEARLEITGDDLGLLIGRHGETLDAVQLVVAIGANKPFDDGARVIVDAADYRARHREMLEEMAADYGEAVKKRGEEAVIEDLKAYERRIIHLALKDDPDVQTYSEGEGADRRLVISPAVDEE